jgi:glycosyltransferase involved in cell wall biosynthesis
MAHADMSTMRVALVRGSLLRPWEVPNYTIDGVRVEAFTSRRTARAMGKMGLPIHALPGVADLTGHLPAPVRAALELTAGNVELLGGLERALRGFDIAHALELANPLTWQATRARAAGACRAVVATVMENTPFRPEPNALVRRRVRTVAAGVDRFVAITERARLHLQTEGVPDDRITLLPLGIDMEHFSPGPAPPSDGPLRVLSVARLERGKGVEDLVIAAGLLARKGIDVEVTLVGAGPLRGRLLEVAGAMGVAERVRLPPPVEWEALPDVYRAHHVFVLASAATVNWREQFGFAMVEAMACGLPALAGASGSLPEVVGRDDALVMPHDPLSLSDALAALAADPQRRQELGTYNRARALERFDVRRVRERLRPLIGAAPQVDVPRVAARELAVARQIRQDRRSPDGERLEHGQALHLGPRQVHERSRVEQQPGDGGAVGHVPEPLRSGAP